MAHNDYIQSTVNQAAAELSERTGYQYPDEFLELLCGAVEAQACLGRLVDALGGYPGVAELPPEQGALLNKLLRRDVVTLGRLTQAASVSAHQDQYSSRASAIRKAEKDLTEQVQALDLSCVLE